MTMYSRMAGAICAVSLLAATAFAGKAVKLRFVLRDADLFAFHFGD